MSQSTTTGVAAEYPQCTAVRAHIVSTGSLRVGLIGFTRPYRYGIVNRFEVVSIGLSF